jgi:hypothetical protein
MPAIMATMEVIAFDHSKCNTNIEVTPQMMQAGPGSRAYRMLGGLLNRLDVRFSNGTSWWSAVLTADALGFSAEEASRHGDYKIGHLLAHVNRTELNALLASAELPNGIFQINWQPVHVTEWVRDHLVSW